MRLQSPCSFLPWLLNMKCGHFEKKLQVIGELKKGNSQMCVSGMLLQYSELRAFLISYGHPLDLYLPDKGSLTVFTVGCMGHMALGASKKPSTALKHPQNVLIE